MFYATYSCVVYSMAVSVAQTTGIFRGA